MNAVIQFKMISRFISQIIISEFEPQPMVNTNVSLRNLSDVRVHTHTYIYIYIYSHPQIDCFVLSEFFSVARQAGRSKPGSKPVQLYVRLCFRPLGHQADHVG